MPESLLALPVRLAVRIRMALVSSTLVRGALGLALAASVMSAAFLATRPVPTIATPPTPIVPLEAAAFSSSVRAGTSVTGAATITFSTPMERASVEAALRVDPPTDVVLTWASDDRTMAVSPAAHWAPDTFHTVTIKPGALAQTGRPLTKPVRASFLTRPATTTTIAATAPVGDRVAADTAFSIVFDGPVDPASVRAGITLVPPVAGTLAATPATEGAARFVFTPGEPLRAGTPYRLVVHGVRDIDGLVTADAALAVRTVTAPKVERIRPGAGSKDIPRDQAISVRFSRPMDRPSTKEAFTVEIDGAPVTGPVRFMEEDTVLLFEPDGRLPYASTVVVRIATTAESAEGAPLGEAGKASFDVVPKPKPRPKAPAAGGGSASGGGDTGGSGGGAVGSGSWVAVERYYLDLMNCTRTGGWVTAGGRCSSPGGRDVAPLKLSSGISSKVARPYAKLLAKRGECGHFIGGDPGDRLRKAGYTSYRWAENLGCRSGNAYDAVLGSHRFFQDEKPYNGGHYRNMMSAKYDRVGIGVWVAGGRVRLVVDFYHP